MRILNLPFLASGFSIDYLINEMKRFPCEDLLFTKKTTDSYHPSYYKRIYKRRSLRSLLYSITEEITDDNRQCSQYKKDIEYYVSFCNEHGLPFRLIDRLDGEQQEKDCLYQRFSEYIEITVVASKLSELLSNMQNQFEVSIEKYIRDDAEIRHKYGTFADKTQDLKILVDAASVLAQKCGSYIHRVFAGIGYGVSHFKLTIDSYGVYLLNHDGNTTIVKYSDYNLNPLNSLEHRNGLFVAILKQLDCLSITAKCLNDSYVSESVLGSYIENNLYSIVIVFKQYIENGSEWY